MWLTLHTMPDGSSTSVEVPWDDAMTFNRHGFAGIYRNSVYGASQTEAYEWADKQIAERAKALGLS